MYISVGFALASSGHRPRRVETQTRDVPTPKKRTPGLTPIIFLEVDVRKTP